VFICCEGCRGRLLGEPGRYLRRQSQSPVAGVQR
jgi:hypothetical protein